MKAIILAAGMGTRIQHLAGGRPKPMLPIGGVPLLAQHLQWLRCHGVTQIAINLHYAPESIIEYIGNGRRFGVSINYSYEEELLGTAGAVKHLENYLDQPFIVVYGDVYTNLHLDRLMAFHQAQIKQYIASPALTLALYPVPNPTECGLVELDDQGRVVRFVEKPPPEQVFTDLANSGVMVCEPDILDAIPAGGFYDFGRDIFPKLLRDHALVSGLAIRADEFVIDVGTPAGYQKAQQQARTQMHTAAWAASA